MPKRNRDILNERCMYDMLCKMNEAMTKLQDEWHLVCVLDALGVERGYCKHCLTGIECDECIREWLNEFQF